MSALYDYDYESPSASPRDVEVTLLQAMYMTSELTITPTDPHSLTVSLSLHPPSTVGRDSIQLSLSVNFPSDYPQTLPSLSLHSKSLLKPPLSLLTKGAVARMTSSRSEGGEALFLDALSYVQDEIEGPAGSGYFAAPAEKAVSAEAAALAARGVKNRARFTREWSSFVSLYKESYASGPNRYEVLMDIATGRGLAVTGMAIAGKPGGLVVEGPGGDVEEFMRLIRTDFFETLNPRGR